MRVIGIDPGYDRLGIAVIEKEQGKEKLLYSDCVTTDKKQTIAERLHTVEQALEKVIVEQMPERLAIERLFFNNNAKTAGAVAEARGVILSKAAEHALPIFEYTPAQIKVAVTGYGKSDKKQVTFMIGKLIRLEKTIKYDDEYDAIATALTCLVSER